MSRIPWDFLFDFGLIEEPRDFALEFEPYGLVHKVSFFVIPAEAGIQNLFIASAFVTGFRLKDCRNDGNKR